MRGLTWQMPGIGKFTVLRYDNEGDPATPSRRDIRLGHQFWSFGARTQIGSIWC